MAYQDGESTCALGRKYGVSNASIYIALRDWGVPIRQTKVVDRSLTKVVNLYNKGWIPSQIHRLLGISEQSVQRALHKAGIDYSRERRERQELLDSHKDEIIEWYLAGVGSWTIAKSFGCRDRHIVGRLERWGIERRPLRQYAVDEHFFDVIDTEEKAYTLGVLYADGCNRPSHPCFSLSMIDEDVVRKISQCLQYRGPIFALPPRGKGKHTQYHLKVSSRYMSDALVNVGCVANKTYYATFPTSNIVPSCLISHFIRGFNDGDGCICKTKKGRWGTSIVGTQSMCCGVKSAVECLKIHSKARFSQKMKKNNGEIWTFVIWRQQDINRYLNWLYHDATIYMDRKFNKYQQFLHEYTNKHKVLTV